jgi:hypothetical protein
MKEESEETPKEQEDETPEDLYRKFQFDQQKNSFFTDYQQIMMSEKS